MDVPLFVLADFASLSGNKLNVMGVFSSIRSSQFPAIHAQMYVVAQVRGELTDYGRKFSLEMKLSDEDGKEVFELKNENMSFSSEKGRERPSLNLIVPIINLLFEKQGTYEFTLFIDDNLVSEAPLELFLQN